ncbi:TIGR02450 family Trp-rich protein [Polynucleobacter arcticus]|uniref:TIGR02450 family Trp-rich protein n=1 Tax=Polynucleobacter arcticus TaxID=1743165 RepID=A0A6M9PN44_9BURK|nr:TIGR02450 family Trp-rich protein [Polynucleobacter arcticus]QKM60778.1 TIGR02450 family Trp-rich protein [Polynucleobacter arcticus]
MLSKQKNPLSPKKLLLTKWTAVNPSNKRKHFLVSKVILPDLPEQSIEYVELEAVFDKQIQLIRWRELSDSSIWLQGWL